MNELATLQAYRAGKVQAQAVLDRFKAAGWDENDVGLLLTNTSYTPQGDAAQQFIDRDTRRRTKQTNALMRGR